GSWPGSTGSAAGACCWGSRTPATPRFLPIASTCSKSSGVRACRSRPWPHRPAGMAAAASSVKSIAGSSRPSSSRNWSVASLISSPDDVDDFSQVVLHDDGAVGVGRRVHPLFAELFFELVGVGRVIGDGCRRVFQLMPGENANHAVAGGDDPLAD